jgi:hypothetical protein
MIKHAIAGLVIASSVPAPVLAQHTPSPQAEADARRIVASYAMALSPRSGPINPRFAILDTIYIAPRPLVAVRAYLFGWHPSPTYVLLLEGDSAIRGGGFPDPEPRRLWGAVGKVVSDTGPLPVARIVAGLLDPSAGDSVLFPSLYDRLPVSARDVIDRWQASRPRHYPSRDSVSLFADTLTAVQVVLLSRYGEQSEPVGGDWHTIVFQFLVARDRSLLSWYAGDEGPSPAR